MLGSSSSARAPDRGTGGKRRGTTIGGGAAKRKKSYEADGAFQCTKCGVSSEKGVKWAAMKMSKGPGGDPIEQPTGSACGACWSHWHAHHRSDPGAETWDKFVLMCDADATYAQKVLHAQKVATNEVPKDFPDEGVDDHIAVNLRIARAFVVVSENELASALGCQKVSKAIKDRLATFRAPKQNDMSEDEILFAFRHPERPHREATVEVVRRIGTGKVCLPGSSSSYPGEGRMHLRTLVEQTMDEVGGTEVATKFQNRAVRTLEDFIQSVKGQGGKKQSDGAAADGDDSVGEDTGRDSSGDDADGDGKPPPSKGSAASSSGGLVGPSPHKPRQPAPRFAEALFRSPPAKGPASVASSRKGGLTSGGSTVFGGSDGKGANTDENSDDEQAASEFGDDQDDGLTDPVALWRSRLPLSEVMEGVPKGRTIKALKGAVQKLSSKDETEHDGHRLRTYLDLVVFANQLRPSNIGKLPGNELKTIVAELTKHEVRFSPQLHAALLEHRIAAVLKGGDMSLIVEVGFPLGEAPWDPLRPTIGAVGWSTHACIDAYKRVVFGRCLIPLLSSGKDKVSLISELCKLLTDKFEAQDACEMEAAMAVTMEETLCSCRVVAALVKFPALADQLTEDIDRLDTAKARSSKGLYGMVAAAISASGYFGERYKQLVKALPAIAELGPHLAETMEKLTNLDSVHAGSMEVLQAAVNACKAVCSARTAFLPDELLQPFSESVAKKVQRFVPKAMVELTAPDGAHLRTMESFLAAATQAFPTDMALLEAQRMLTASKDSLASEAAIKALVEHVKACTESTLANDLPTAEKLKTLQHSLTGCDGLTLPSDAKSDLRVVIYNMADGLKTECESDDGIDLNFLATLTEAMDNVCKLLGEPSLDALCSVANAVHNMLCHTAQVHKLAEGGPLLEEVWAELQVLQVSTKQSQAAIEKAKVPNSSVLASSYLKQMVNITETSRAMASDFVDKFLEARAIELKTACTMCETLGGKHLTAQAWHGGAKDSDTFANLQEKAKGTLDSLDLKDMMAAISNLKLCMDKYQLVLGSSSHDGPPEPMGTANDILKNMTLLKAESSLLWHLGQERDHDALREKVRSEIRELRACGLQERAALHPAMFRRAHEALVLKHKK